MFDKELIQEFCNQNREAIELSLVSHLPVINNHHYAKTVISELKRNKDYSFIKALQFSLPIEVLPNEYKRLHLAVYFFSFGESVECVAVNTSYL